MCDITTPDRAASITPADQDARDAFLDRYTDYTMTTELYDRHGGARGASGAVLTAAAFTNVA